jgi:hypothetical protein
MSTRTIFLALTTDIYLAQELYRVPKRLTIAVMSANVLHYTQAIQSVVQELDKGAE